MMQPVSQERLRFLRNEIIRWEEENILVVGQGDRILSRYQPLPHNGRIRAIASILGAMVVGAGIFLFVSANTQAVGLVPRLVLLAAVLVVCYGMGWRLKVDRSGNTALKRLLMQGKPLEIAR